MVSPRYWLRLYLFILSLLFLGSLLLIIAGETCAQMLCGAFTPLYISIFIGHATGSSLLILSFLRWYPKRSNWYWQGFIILGVHVAALPLTIWFTGALLCLAVYITGGIGQCQRLFPFPL